MIVSTSKEDTHEWLYSRLSGWRAACHIHRNRFSAKGAATDPATDTSEALRKKVAAGDVDFICQDWFFFVMMDSCYFCTRYSGDAMVRKNSKIDFIVCAVVGIRV